ncbi:MAG TPA: hypothetical protein VN137_05530 [Sphingomonas sp.]|nr:hypothetical protein [Sphingomonas sp.]
MMEGAGLLLMTLAFALMLVPPLHISIARPSTGAGHVEGALSERYHPAPPHADFDDLIRDADSAPANDTLIRATAAIAEAYDQA